MKATFELRTWLSENRETIISEYEQLSNEEFFNGMSLQNFMIAVLNTMAINNPKSEKRSASLLPHVMGNIYFNNSNGTKLIK